MAFTIVFPGKARSFGGNPFEAETPFGKVQSISVGDIIAYEDILREALEAIVDGPMSAASMQEAAQAALDQVDHLMADELGLKRKAAQP